VPDERHSPEPVPDPVTPGTVIRYSLRLGRRQLIAGSLFTALHQGAETAVPIVLGEVIDRAIAPGDPVALIVWIAVLALLFLVLTSAMRIGLRNGTRGIEGTGHALRVLLVRRVLDPRGAEGAGPGSGALLSTTSVDAAGVGMYNSGIRRILSAVGALIVAAAVLLSISVPLGLFILLGLPLWLLLMRRLAGPVANRVRAQRATAAQASQQAADYVRGLRTLTGIGGTEEALRRFHHTSEQSRGAAVRSAAAQAGYDGLNTVLTGVFLAVAALIAGILADQGKISIGQIVTAVGLASALIGPFSIIAGAARLLAGARVSAQRVADALATPPAVTEGAGRPASVVGALDVDIASLRLNVAAGESVGVVCPEPTDAIALLNWLSRKEDPPSGAIRLDGVDIRTLRLADLREAIGVSAHDAPLFSGTVRDNVLAHGPADRLDPALRAAAAEDIVAGLPDGVDTEITERGRSLSGGQRQRLALARALAAAPAVLVLHDPTTAVDAATEARIADGIRADRAGRTTLLFTSSPNLLSIVDRVVLVRDGGIHAEGTHADLSNAEPDYRDLVLT
jgi:putative ABC transport system ATP-binding protein